MTIETISRPDDRDEWLRLRHRYWNASSAATLLHRHPFQTLHTEITAKLAPWAPTYKHHVAMAKHEYQSIEKQAGVRWPLADRDDSAHVEAWTWVDKMRTQMVTELKAGTFVAATPASSGGLVTTVENSNPAG
jgi:hypothetical protein